ncbi:MAG: hypothetical protein R3F19_18900 [Verrucomicrobiales bacterium]
MMSLVFAVLLAAYAKGCIEYLIRIQFDVVEIYWFWKWYVWS